MSGTVWARSDGFTSAERAESWWFFSLLSERKSGKGLDLGDTCLFHGQMEAFGF